MQLMFNFQFQGDCILIKVAPYYSNSKYSALHKHWNFLANMNKYFSRSDHQHKALTNNIQPSHRLVWVGWDI